MAGQQWNPLTASHRLARQPSASPTGVVTRLLLTAGNNLAPATGASLPSRASGFGYGCHTLDAWLLKFLLHVLTLILKH